MKTVFKPLGIAAAVAAVTAGYTGAVFAQPEVSSRNSGDLALIPYYGVQNGFATAVHIINTSNSTQVVKLRARRGSDSMDSLDFNIIMSPKDEWVGSMTQDENGVIKFTSRDTTCTAPAGTPAGDGRVEFIMPDITSPDTLVNFRDGAEEGYIEVIGMGQPEFETSPIAIAAKHVAGVPRDCTAVRSNFFRDGSALDNGVESNSNTWQTCATPGVGACNAAGVEENLYDDTEDDALTVSWAVTDAESGLEVGSNAVHIEGFAFAPMITNQETIVFGATDPLGYLFPDLDGGSPVVGVRGRYEGVRQVLGATSLHNDWTSRSTDAFDVQTDWVVTMPGQYLMVDPVAYLASLADPDSAAFSPCLTDAQAAAVNPPVAPCDFRDIPAELSITYYDREEGEFTPAEGGLVVSPSINLTPEGIVLPYETNVVYWKVDADEILGSQYAVAFSPLFEEDRGWSRLSVSPTSTKVQKIWNYADPNNPDAVVNVAIPIIGFAAWERVFTDSPDANYGRAIDHGKGPAL